MQKQYKLDNVFGPVGRVAGWVLLGAGLYAIWFSWTGILLILMGAFTAFTTTGSEIDFEHKKIKPYNNIFGVVKIGKWIQIEHGMKAGIKHSNQVWTAYSRGNMSINIDESDFRIVIIQKNEKEYLPIIKTSSLQEAEALLEKLNTSLMMA